MRKNYIKYSWLVTTLIVAATANSNNILSECPKNKPLNHTVLIPHETHCTRFYMCDGYKKVLMKCPYMASGKRLHFNAKLQTCDMPSKAGCTLGESSSTTTERETQSTKIIDQITSTTERSKTTSKKPIITSSTKGRTTVTSNPPTVTQTSSKPTTTSKPETTRTTKTTNKVTIITEPSSPQTAGTSSTESKPTEIPNPPILTEIPTSNFESNSTDPIFTMTECPPFNTNIRLPHENNCSLFYICDNGNKVLQECPNGLHFNNKLQNCDWPQNANCEITTQSTQTVSTTPDIETIPTKCPKQDSDKNVYLPHECDCRKYYLCKNGDQILRECPSDMHFVPDLQKCVNGSTCDDIYTTDQRSTTVNIIECQEGTHLPHEKYCSLYYNCENGRKVLEKCSDGLYFNKKKLTCDFPDNVDCGNLSTDEVIQSTKPISSTSAIPTQETSSTTKKTTEPSSSSSKVTTTSVPSSSSSKVTTTSVPSSSSSKVTTTSAPSSSSSKVTTTSAPSSSSSKITTTSAPSSSSSKITTTSEPSSSSSKITTTSEPSSSSSKVTTTSAPSSSSSKVTTISIPSSSTTQSSTPANECPKQNTEDVVLLPHETNCTLFYICDHGRKVLQFCPANLYFNPKTMRCDWPTNVDCEMNETSHITRPPVSIPTIPNSSDNVLIPTHCPKYDLGNVIHLSHESNCSLFYKCNHGDKILLECPNNLHFNPYLQVCDYPSNANCYTVHTSGRPKTTTINKVKVKRGASPVNDYEKKASLKESTIDFSTTISTTEEWRNPKTCVGRCPQVDPENESVYLPNIDCTKFCECSNGQAYVRPCPPGLHFNSTIQVCDFPELVNCTSSTLSPSTTQRILISTKSSSTPEGFFSRLWHIFG